MLVGLRKHSGLSLHVAHLNHMLREGAAAADAAFVRSTAEAWGLPVTIEQLDIAAYAAAERLNLHDAARRARYAFLARCAAAIGARSVAVGHHADDQAETVLLHLLRGAGVDGLAAMRPVAPMLGNPNIQLIRPLLTTSRAEIAAYCATHGLMPRQDATNSDQTYTRNRIRHELLPHLLAYNPRIVAALGRTASASADDSAFVQQHLDATWPQLAVERDGGITLQGQVWQGLHPALQRAALRRAYTALGGAATLGWEQIEQARQLAAGSVGGQLPLPGGLLLHIGYAGNIILGTSGEVGPQIIRAETLDLPCIIELTAGWQLRAGLGETPSVGRWSVVLDWAALVPPLVIRGRQPGDRIRPAGGRGSRRIQDVLVDAKVPRQLRARWPLLADAQQIVWVAGLRAAEGCLATPATSDPVWVSDRCYHRNSILRGAE